MEAKADALTNEISKLLNMGNEIGQACGSSTRRMTCKFVMPIDLAASNCPFLTAANAPLKISLLLIADIKLKAAIAIQTMLKSLNRKVQCIDSAQISNCLAEIRYNAKITKTTGTPFKTVTITCRTGARILILYRRIKAMINPTTAPMTSAVNAIKSVVPI